MQILLSIVKKKIDLKKKEPLIIQWPLFCDNRAINFLLPTFHYMLADQARIKGATD
jgi:hypothetical protein